MASASGEILVQEAKIMEEWMGALVEDRDGKNATNLDEDIEIEDEELKLDGNQAQKKQYL